MLVRLYSSTMIAPLLLTATPMLSRPRLAVFGMRPVANITASRLTFEKQRKIRIFQEDAYISLDYGAQTGRIIRKVGDQISQEDVLIEKAEPLKEEIRFFLGGIASGKSIGKPDTAARNALALAIEIVKVIQENQTKPATK